jgi:predicted metal-dependent hydrolase
MGLAALGLQLVLPLFGLDSPAPAVAPKSTNRDSERHVILAGQAVPYTLLRSKRRTIGFQIDGRGLTVSAPRWAALRDIDQALQEKSKWILRKLVEWRQHEEKRKKLTIDWRDGVAFPLLGNMITLRLGDRSEAGSNTTLECDAQTGKPSILWLHLPPNASADQCSDTAQAWCQQQARAIFTERLDFFAQQTGRRPSRWGLSSAKTRWGSCTADGHIRLNWRLVHFPLDVVDYVIAHELSHMEQMNHSPQFWETVGRLMPEFEKAKQTLAQYPQDW